MQYVEGKSIINVNNSNNPTAGNPDYAGDIALPDGSISTVGN